VPALPLVDLVLSSLGRAAEPRRLLASLATQTLADFRVILVDQNSDDRLQEVVAVHRDAFPIVHLRTTEAGLSRGRNAGISRLAAELVAFPDDDCWYPPDLLERIVACFAARSEWDGLAGTTTDADGSLSGLRWPRRAASITRQNVARSSIAPAVFLRRRVIEAVGSFDVELGAGAGTPWGSGEETDYLLRALEMGFRIVYEPTLSVYHPGPAPGLRDGSAMRKAYSYGVGHARVLRSHGFPSTYVAWRALQLAAGAPVFTLVGQPGLSRYYLAMARGRAGGLLART